MASAQDELMIIPLPGEVWKYHAKAVTQIVAAVGFAREFIWFTTVSAFWELLQYELVVVWEPKDGHSSFGFVREINKEMYKMPKSPLFLKDIIEHPNILDFEEK